ncbi:MAG: Mov34/MPN/PAD-1 family protein [Candidatus Bathyarchaeia archaeon]
MGSETTVLITHEVLESILQHAKHVHPKEMILLLRGKTSKNQIKITDLIIPPFFTHGRGFSGFQPHMLPMDFSLIGLVHSHPSGILLPSTEDLNRMYGRIMMIVGFPYNGIENIAVYDRQGQMLKLQVI